MQRRKMPSEKVASRASHRNRQIENAENAASSFFWKKIGHKRRRDGGKNRLANPDQSMAHQQFMVSVSDGG